MNVGDATENLNIYNYTTSTTNFTILKANDNVGISTSAPSASLHIRSTTSGATLLRTDGTNGTLFSVIDDLSDSLMSVNNSAGLPVLEVFADDRIVAGQYGQNDFVSLHVVGTITGDNTFEIELLSSDTASLDGTYTQQPVITSFSGSEYRPSQGTILILPQIPVP